LSEAPNSSTSAPGPGHRTQLTLLTGCQALNVTGTSLMVTITALVGLQLAPDPRLATLPMGFQALAAMLFALPASLIMKHRGRRFGFALGAVAATVGALLAAFAVVIESFWILCSGLFLFGVAVGAFQFYRFAAADAVPEDERARAISMVLAGGLVAAFLGPNLASWSRNAIATVPFLATFLTLVGIQLVTLVLLAFTDPSVPATTESDESRTPVREYARRPLFLAAVFGAIVSYGVMNSLMAATPLAMEAHGYMFHHTASVVQWHVVGMFAPSFVSGRLTQRFGTLPMMAAGALILAAGAGIHLAGVSRAHFMIGLAAVGIGWNFLFVAASTLLTTTYATHEKATAQGLNDLLIYATVTFTATTSGGLYETLGWKTMNTVALVPVALVLVVVALVATRSGEPAP